MSQPSLPEPALSIPDSHSAVFRRVIDQSRLWHERWPNHPASAHHNDTAKSSLPRTCSGLGGQQRHSKSTTLHVKKPFDTISNRNSRTLCCSYELPPPSRSRENNVNIFDPNYKAPVYQQPNPQVTPANTFNDQFGYQVVPIYIPNEGYRYFVIVPVDKWHFLNTNLIESDRKSQEQKYDKYDKYNGRYNAKLKKYKAYEKFIKPQVSAD